MKKLLLKTMLFATLACLSVYSSADVLADPSSVVVEIEHQGNTIALSNNIQQQLLLYLNGDEDARYNVAIRPVSQYITNFSNTVQIPVENLYINSEDVHLIYDQYYNLYSGIDGYRVTKSLFAKVKNYGVVPSDTYSVDLEVQVSNSDTGVVEATIPLNLRFVVPVIHELDINSENPQITITAADAFSKNKKIPAASVVRVSVTSNTDWILSLDTSGFENSVGDFYVVTTANTDETVTNRLKDRALIVTGREIVLARGSAPALNKKVSVEFSVENPEGKVMKAGEYTNMVRYILREGVN